ncbi:MAG: hypothetical protein COA78_37940 [Blastopirellula sp.]|nr:MAG: hypothetical protein COA78_37940 [Blastopirellula sp.]
MRSQIANLLHKLANVVGGISNQADYESRERLDKIFMDFSAEVETKYEATLKEQSRRSKLGLLDATMPPQWESQFYLPQGYRVLVASEDSQNHWRGGPPKHEGAICPICKKPLLLFWDIDCNELRSRGNSTEIFGDLDRLPLYYCCRRPEPTIYQVLSINKIQTIRPELVSDEESPFEDYPNEFERKPIKLEPIPRAIENLLIIAKYFDLPWLNSDECKLLSSYLKEEISSTCDIHLSQFGGAIDLTQGRDVLKCPNKTCSTHDMGSPFSDDTFNKMKELAVIDVDSGFEFKSNYSQIVFHICWKCSTIHADYRCS